jgi:hypothetical protein
MSSAFGLPPESGVSASPKAAGAVASSTTKSAPSRGAVRLSRVRSRSAGKARGILLRATSR